MDLEKLFEGVNKEILTDDLKLKIKTLVEVAVTEKTEAHKKTLNEKFDLYLKEQSAALEKKNETFVKEEVLPMIDRYITHTADEYVKENKLAIKEGIKTKLFESMSTGIRELMAKHSIKEEDIDHIKASDTENKKLRQEVEALTEKLIDSKQHAKATEAVRVFESAVADLSQTQKEKMKELSKDFDVDDAEEFGKKLGFLKESIVAASKPAAPAAPAPKSTPAKPVTPAAASAQKVTESIVDPDLEKTDISEAQQRISIRPEGAASAAFDDQDDVYKELL